MRRDKRQLGLVRLLCTAIFLSLLLLSQAALGQAETASGVGINTDRVKFGEALVLSGFGFTPGDVVAFWVTSPEGNALDYASGKVGEKGSFGGLMGKPFVAATPGRWFITAQSIQTGLQFIGAFTLEAPQISLTAQLAGSTITLTAWQGNFFYPFERVSFWVTDAVGKVTDLGSLVAGNVGELPPGYSATFAASSGSYKLTAYGNLSKSTTVLEFNP